MGKKNYIDLYKENEDSNYIELTGKSNTTIERIEPNSPYRYRIQEDIYFGNREIRISYTAKQHGKAVSNVWNTFFNDSVSAKYFNSIGYITYKIELLERIKEYLSNKKENDREQNNKGRSC